MPLLGRIALLAISGLVLELFAGPSYAQSNRYGPLDEQARQALEGHNFAKDLVHEMRVFRFEPWPVQLQRDPWAMMLFANGHLTVQSHNQAPFARYAKSTPLASSLVGNGSLVQDTYVTQVKVAYREVEKITYRNTWTEGAYEKRSLRFNYYLVSYWPELQRAGPFDGLVVLQREPSTGDWVNLSVRVPDRGLEELIGQAQTVQSGYATKFQGEIAALAASGQQSQTAAIQSRFERIGPNLVRDNQTKLLWAGPMYEVKSKRDGNPWAQKEQRVASEICASGNFDGQRGWALPTRTQLQTIVDEKTGGLADGPNSVVWGKLADFWVPILTSEFSDGATRVIGWSQSQRRFEVSDANMRGVAFCVRALVTVSVSPSAVASPSAQRTDIPPVAKPANLRGITLGMPMEKANAAALQSCKKIEDDVRIESGKWCDIADRGGQSSSARDPWRLHWAPNSRGLVYSTMEDYFVPARDPLTECKQQLDTFKTSTGDMRLIGLAVLEHKEVPAWSGGKEAVNFQQDFDFEGYPHGASRNSQAPGFHFSCKNFSHTDVLSDKVLVEVTLHDRRLFFQPDAMTSASPVDTKPGALASTSRVGDTPAAMPSRLGPSFDCTASAVTSQPLAQIICTDKELAVTDLKYIIVYQALRHASNEEGRKALLAEANAFVQATTEECKVPKTGRLNRAATSTELACLRGRYNAQREGLLKRARGDALGEATLAPAEAVAIQAGLKAKGLLPQDAATDGVFGPITRAAIAQWQRSAGVPDSGFASQAMLAPSTGVGSLRVDTPATQK